MIMGEASGEASRLRQVPAGRQEGFVFAQLVDNKQLVSGIYLIFSPVTAATSSSARPSLAATGQTGSAEKRLRTKKLRQNLAQLLLRRVLQSVWIFPACITPRAYFNASRLVNTLISSVLRQPRYRSGCWRFCFAPSRGFIWKCRHLIRAATEWVCGFLSCGLSFLYVAFVGVYG